MIDEMAYFWKNMMDIGFTHFGFGLGRGGTLDGGTSRAEL